MKKFFLFHFWKHWILLKILSDTFISNKLGSFFVFQSYLICASIYLYILFTLSLFTGFLKTVLLKYSVYSIKFTHYKNKLSLLEVNLYYVSRSVISQLFATPWVVACQAPLSMGILQARILEWVVISFSKGLSQTRDQTQVSHVAVRFFTIWASREAHWSYWVLVNL